MDICLNGKFSVCGGGRGVDSVQFSRDCDLCHSVQLVDAVSFCPNLLALSLLRPEVVS